MTAMTLPQDFEAWAKNEVDAGRAADVAEVAQAALADYRRRRDEAQLAAFRESLDRAAEDVRRNGGLTTDEVFDPILARLRAQL